MAKPQKAAVLALSAACFVYGERIGQIFRQGFRLHLERVDQRVKKQYNRDVKSGENNLTKYLDKYLNNS